MVSALRELIVNDFYFLKLSDKCPDGWDEYEDLCYKFDLRTKAYFGEAERSCRSLNADILVINSWEENEFIKKNIDQHLDYGDTVWLGMKLSRSLGEVAWKLLNGHDPSFNLMSDRFTQYFAQHRMSSFRGGSFGGPRFHPGSRFAGVNNYCATLMNGRSAWLGVDCNGARAYTVCKRPISNQEDSDEEEF